MYRTCMAQGAEMNVTDLQHRTPLLLAAIRGGEATIRILALPIRDHCSIV